MNIQVCVVSVQCFSINVWNVWKSVNVIKSSSSFCLSIWKKETHTIFTKTDVWHSNTESYHKSASVHLNSVSVVCIVRDGLDGVHPAVNLHSLWHTILFLRQCPGVYLNCFLLGNWNMGDKQDDSESRAGSSSNNCQERMIDSTLYYILLEKWNHLKNTVSRDLVGFWVKQINHFRYIALI